MSDPTPFDNTPTVHIAVLHELALKMGYKLADLDTISDIVAGPDKISVTRMFQTEEGHPMLLRDPKGHRHLATYVEQFRVVRHTPEELDNNG